MRQNLLVGINIRSTIGSYTIKSLSFVQKYNFLILALTTASSNSNQNLRSFVSL